MATAEELLAQMEEDPEAYADGPVDDIITIDAEKRTINIPVSEILFGVKYDKDVERKHFRCPKIVGDNIDLSAHKIYISYITSDAKGLLFNGDSGLYYCEDMAVDGDYITFSWLLSGNVFANPGFIAFKVLATYMDGENIKTSWNTTPAVGTVLMTVPDGQEIVERYPDVIGQILTRLESLESCGGTGSPGKQVELRNSGTAIQWRYVGDAAWTDLVQISDITGPPGKDGITPHIGDNGNWYLGDEDTGKPSRGEPGADGAAGQSAYELWLSQDGNAGKTEAQFLESLKGDKGDTGATGEKGEKGDAFTYADFTTEQLEELEGKPGEPGKDGKSAYEYAQESGYEGTEEEFSEKLAKEYVGFEDYPSDNKAGVVKATNPDGMGIEILNGEVRLKPADEAQIAQKPTGNIRRPITSKHIDYTSVQAAHQEMSNDYDPSTAVTPDGNVPYAYGDRQPVSYAAVKGYVDDKQYDWLKEPILEINLTEEVAYIIQTLEQQYDEVFVITVGVTETSGTATIRLFTDNTSPGIDNARVYVFKAFSYGSDASGNRYNYINVKPLNDVFSVVESTSIGQGIEGAQQTQSKYTAILTRKSITGISFASKSNLLAGTKIIIYGKPARKGATT